MRAPLSAAVLLIAAPILSVAMSGPGLAQAPPPVVLVPEQAPPPAPNAPAPPAPPPTVLLPPSSSEVPSDEAPARPPPPVVRQRSTAAILQALDKTTAETLRFEAPIGQPIRYKDLIFTVHVCENAAPNSGQRGASAHLEIQSSPRPIPGRETPPTRQLFKGWMFANAPGLHPFEHPVYDAWLIGCKTMPVPVTEAPARPAPAPKPPPPPPTVLLPPQPGR